MSEYEECVVSFLDVLGFRSLLKTSTAAEISKILSVFRQVSEPEKIVPARRMKEHRLYSEAIQEIVSDAVVRARTTETQSQDGAFIWELIDLLHIQIECVANGVLLRGAVTLGPMHLGMDLQGPVFGEALVRAYEMEENEAIYPRIVVEESAVERFVTDRGLWREGHDFDDENRHLQKLLKQDEAGLYFIDYLGASLEELDHGFVGYLELLEKHKSMIEGGIAHSGGNAKISRKYNWLKRYHNAQIDDDLAGLKPDAFVGDLGRPAEELLRELRI